MYFAIDVASGQRVEASLAQRYRRYSCPVCDARVSPRQGTYRDAHFAHVSGAARPECYLYHASEGWQGPGAEPAVQTRPEPATPQLPLALTLHVQPPVGRVSARWGLEVQIPRAPTPRGRLTFDGGGDGFRVEVACARLHAGAQAYAVNPDSPAFRVAWVSADVDNAFGVAVQERISGLDSARSTVFSAGRGSRQALATGLDWGATYYFVQRAELLTSVPPQLAVTRLVDLKQWSCLLVTLPQVADEGLAEWIRRATGLAVQQAKRLWGVVSPPMHFIDASARLVLDTKGELTLAVHAGDGHGEANLLARSGEDRASVPLARGQWQFIRVGGFPATEPPVLEAEGRLLPEVLVRPVVRAARGALLTFGSRSVSASSAEARPLLEQVRAGSLELSGLNVPRGLVPSLRSRPAGAVDWAQHVFATTAADLHSAAEAVTTEALAELQVALRDTKRDVVLDLGPFGAWWFDMREAPDGPTRHLPPATRAHARWLLAAAGQAGVASRSPSDEALSTALRAMIAPRWLEAHHRLALTRIRGNRDAT